MSSPPLQARPDNNSVVAFKDNSSAIRGFKVKPLLPLNPGGPSALAPQARDWDLLLTAETHNFPCAVAPYPGGYSAVQCSTVQYRQTGRLLVAEGLREQLWWRWVVRSVQWYLVHLVSA